MIFLDVDMGFSPFFVNCFRISIEVIYVHLESINVKRKIISPDSIKTLMYKYLPDVTEDTEITV